MAKPKLTREDCEDIRRMYRNPKQAITNLAYLFHVNPATINRVLNGKYTTLEDHMQKRKGPRENMPTPTTKQNRRKQELEEQIIDLAKRARLDCWNEFVEELKIPSELVPALITNRPELVRLVQPRPLAAEEAQALYTLIGALLETNVALREHAQHVATMCENWTGSIYSMVKVAGRIGRYAEFRHDDAAAEGDDDD